MLISQDHGVILDQVKAISAFKIAVAECLALNIPLSTLYKSLGGLATDMVPGQVKDLQDASQKPESPVKVLDIEMVKEIIRNELGRIGLAAQGLNTVKR